MQFTLIFLTLSFCFFYPPLPTVEVTEKVTLLKSTDWDTYDDAADAFQKTLNHACMFDCPLPLKVGGFFKSTSHPVCANAFQI